MLGFYASKFPTVEINNTFYRMPKEQVLLDWAAQVPEERETYPNDPIHKPNHDGKMP